MNRRGFLIGLAAVPVIAGVGVSVAASRYSPDYEPLLARLLALQGKNLQSSGSWNPSQIFQHLAQSIQGSLQGFPEHKAAWFSHTVGPLALQLFKAAGAMQHPLDQPIPGMAALDPALSVDYALGHLVATLQNFNDAIELQPHFAYGNLSKADYLAAHQLHIEQHLGQISVVG